MKKILLASWLIAASSYTATTPSKVILFSAKRNQSAMDYFNQLTSKGYVIVDFYADWCGPCKSISPIFNQLSNECNKVTFIKVDIDIYKEIAQKFKVRSIPQLLLFKHGSLVKTLVGKQSKRQINKEIKNHFK